jgi:hypothetical protein
MRVLLDECLPRKLKSAFPTRYTESVASTIKPRRYGGQPESSSPSDAAMVGEFPPHSLEADLAAIGLSAPLSEWAKLPADYFANLDYYLHGKAGRM